MAASMIEREPRVGDLRKVLVTPGRFEIRERGQEWVPPVFKMQVLTVFGWEDVDMTEFDPR